jgi:hypothetical protein
MDKPPSEEVPMIHPPAVCEKAQQVERLLLRLEAGEPFDRVRADLGLSVRAEDVPKLQAKYEAGGRTWEALIDGRYGHPQTAHSALREWMYERRSQEEEEAGPAPVAQSRESLDNGGAFFPGGGEARDGDHRDS